MFGNKESKQEKQDAKLQEFIMHVFEYTKTHIYAVFYTSLSV